MAGDGRLGKKSVDGNGQGEFSQSLSNHTSKWPVGYINYKRDELFILLIIFKLNLSCASGTGLSTENIGANLRDVMWVLVGLIVKGNCIRPSGVSMLLD